MNPPSKKKYGYYMDGKLGKGFEEWKKTAHFVKDSWWNLWVERLSKLSGKEIPSNSKAGNEKYKAIEPAPGRYVKEKC
jgi:polyhydroxyalkanoate synthase